MDWTLTLAAFILGLVLGYVIRTLVARNEAGEDHQKLAQQAMLELSQYKQSVSDLHAEQGQQLTVLSEQLEKVKRQWQDTGEHLHIALPDAQQAAISQSQEADKSVS